MLSDSEVRTRALEQDSWRRGDFEVGLGKRVGYLSAEEDKGQSRFGREGNATGGKEVPSLQAGWRFTWIPKASSLVAMSHYALQKSPPPSPGCVRGHPCALREEPSENRP